MSMQKKFLLHPPSCNTHQRFVAKGPVPLYREPIPDQRHNLLELGPHRATDCNAELSERGVDGRPIPGVVADGLGVVWWVWCGVMSHGWE